jgi:uncharacterized protein
LPASSLFRRIRYPSSPGALITSMSTKPSNPPTHGAAFDALPLPMPNADAERYWAAAKAGKLCLQRCGHCQTFRFPPGYACRRCGSTETEWIDTSGRGTIYSFSVIHRGPTPEFAGVVPYVLALVELEEGPRMMTHIVGEPADKIAIGDRVVVEFEERREGVKVPQFRRAL